ncbi:F0F1 ATP synthase subunit B [Phaeocystidibacter luteus]|uniref:ATP synthase subunit b n=1 Tax=Phaeocystidibacter luteus TaxID=911197 RepID=A0A6N6RKG6_9FLAO|nr:F0F1 ATP synthase subunit B [Phaeocystidibacter luteus]KAB2810115.1 F0F1 ATP synthase subunit B [Phaeocystidibacter luteus]
MDLVTPGLGLIFWTSLVFFLLIFLLAKFAWKPILGAVKTRESAIEDALKSAERARDEMKNLQADNENLLKRAREERDNILKEARTMKEKTIAEAKEAASSEADKIIAAAKEQIAHEKMAAITELKNQVASLSIEMAEKVLRAELKDASAQTEMVERLVDDVKLN